MSANTAAAIGLLGWCRQGFEPELAAEYQSKAAELGVAGYAKAQRDSGYVEFLCEDAAALSQQLGTNSLIFARQSIGMLASLPNLPREDRITPILNVLREMGLNGFGSVAVEYSDADSGREFSGLARSLGNALRAALRKHGFMSGKDRPHLPCLHLLLTGAESGILGVSDYSQRPAFPMGIPRLRMNAQAPSRSALKLEEALLTLLTESEREKWLRDGMRACDLGAAPGGWTWVLMRHGLLVTAIDNGPLREHLLENGRVEHLRADGFRWSPKFPLEWMVCDMVEQPARVAQRMGEWFANDWCRRSIFNLKLPMKKRYAEVEHCLQRFTEAAGMPLDIRVKQLYHDREEITVYAGIISRKDR